MFGCYRRGDANDPDTYVAAVAMVLSKYPANVIKTVTDPYSGLPGRKSENGYSGLPDVADVKEACEAEMARCARLEKYNSWPESRPRLPKPAPGPGAFANVLVRGSHPRYAAYLERAKTADTREYEIVPEGIRIGLSWLEGPAQAKHFKVPTIEDLQAIYAAKEEAA